MVTTIEQAIHPLILTSSLLGLGIYSSKKPYLSIFYNLTLWIIYVCLFYYIVTVLKVEVFQSTYAIIDLQFGILTSITSVIVNMYLNKRFQIIIKRLAAVDNTLKELGIPKLYRKLHICAKGVLTGWLICSCMGNMWDMTWWMYVKEDHRYLLIPSITNYFYHVNMYVDLLFVTILWHLHLELCQIARQLNVIFGIQITMEIGAYLILIIRLCNYIFVHIKTKGHFIVATFNWFNLYYWLFLHVTKIFFLNYVCETVSAKSNKIKIIHQLTDFRRYADIREEISQFILQIIQHPLRFTALGFFYLGNSFIRKFVITITTFVIIIIQMSPIPHTHKEYNGF